MSQNQLHLYSIMPLDEEHIAEICEDIRQQVKNGVAACPLFKMTLVPEGIPPVNKAEAFCKTYCRYKEQLDQMGIPNGVLVQATIGHGWNLERFPYQRYTNLTDGKTPDVVCPYDEGFRKYIRDAFETIAKCEPDHIMVDDDFRLIARPGKGCACPLHLARFAELAGIELTREALWDNLASETEEGRRYMDFFVQIQGEALLGAASAMREGVDRVDPHLPMSFCCCGGQAEFADQIAQILAGEGNPVVIRINNGYYSKEGAKILTRAFERAACQMAKLADKTNVFLAETDTCPQNRYSSSAMMLHAHFTGTLLEGALGAKQWITRLAAYEPHSGKAYREKLARYRGYYEELARIVPTLSPVGCRIPVSNRRYFSVNSESFGSSAWNTCVLNRMGLPLYFSSEDGGAVMLAGKEDRSFSDEEIRQMLSGAVFLSSDAARSLIDRGFGEEIGVDVRKWNGENPRMEICSHNGQKVSIQVGCQELIVRDESAVVESMVCHSKNRIDYKPLFPGVVYYKNHLGGKVATFCGTPAAEYNISQAYSFLNETRKGQLISLLCRMGKLPIYYVGDEEIYLRAARMKDDGMFCALFDLSFDPLDEIVFWSETPIGRGERLRSDGTWEPVGVRTLDRETYVIETEASPLDPVILRLYK